MLSSDMGTAIVSLITNQVSVFRGQLHSRGCIPHRESVVVKQGTADKINAAGSAVLGNHWPPISGTAYFAVLFLGTRQVNRSPISMVMLSYQAYCQMSPWSILPSHVVLLHFHQCYHCISNVGACLKGSLLLCDLPATAEGVVNARNQ